MPSIEIWNHLIGTMHVDLQWKLYYVQIHNILSLITNRIYLIGDALSHRIYRIDDALLYSASEHIKCMIACAL